MPGKKRKEIKRILFSISSSKDKILAVTRISCPWFIESTDQMISVARGLPRIKLIPRYLQLSWSSIHYLQTSGGALKLNSDRQFMCKCMSQIRTKLIIPGVNDSMVGNKSDAILIHTISPKPNPQQQLPNKTSADVVKAATQEILAWGR